MIGSTVGRWRKGRNILGLLLVATVSLAGCNFLPFGPEEEEEAEQEAAKFEPPVLVVDTGIQPRRAEIPPAGDGVSRPLAALIDPEGQQLDFVENEVVVGSDDRERVEGFAQQWSGTIVDEVEIPEESSAPTQFLVRIDPDAADPSAVGQHLQDLHEGARGTLQVSSERGVKLMAVAASAGAEEGLSVSINWLLEPASIIERSTAEMGARASEAGYSPDAFTWPYMSRGSAQDIGAAEAWRLLEDSGHSNTRIGLMIADAGFLERDDFASDSVIEPPNSYGQINPVECGGGSTCDYHGLHVAETALAIPDNGSGVAGPAGPVARPIFLQSPSFDVFSVVSYLRAITSRVPSYAVRILNISATKPVHAAIMGIAKRPMDDVFSTLRLINVVTVAAAGNEGKNIDARDCIGKGPLKKCWEKHAYLPCEADDVVCVGGLEWDSTERAENSNYSSGIGNGVDIFGPYRVWGTADPSDVGTDDPSGIRIRSGTSQAAPFVAGVIAQIWAANPNASSFRVLETLYRTAHTGSSDADVSRWVNAYGAVLEALGDGPPYAQILEPSDPRSIVARTGLIRLRGDYDDPEGAANVGATWISNRDGELGIGPSILTSLHAYGTHTITFAVEDSAGNLVERDFTVEARNVPPTAEITAPTGLYRSVGEEIRFEANSQDPNIDGVPDPLRELPEDSLVWTSDIDGYLGTGHIMTTQLSEGSHTVTLEVTDDAGATALDDKLVFVRDDANQPPTISILEPSDGDMWFVGFPKSTSVTLRAVASDPEDGDLTGQIQWETDRDDLQDAQLGTGGSISATLHGQNTSCNYHVITATVRDSDGTQRSADVRVCVNVEPA